MNHQSAIKETSEGTVIKVHIQPRASKNEFVGLHGEALKFRVAAPPVEGAANQALCRYLADRLDVPKSAVVVAFGQTGRQKRVLIKGVGAKRIQERLGLEAGS